MTPIEARIPALPEHLQVVPEDRAGWLSWRTAVLAYRTLIHRLCDENAEMAALQYELAARDPEYWRVMFGVLYEPRQTLDIMIDAQGNEVSFIKPQGWYPWIPFPFQVRMGRWIQDVKTRHYDPHGKSDGVCEKSREMGASWEFCKEAAHDFLFANNVTIGMLSRKEDMVDAPEDARSLFYKVRALIGIYAKVPEKAYAPATLWHEAPCRAPVWMRPANWEAKSNDFRGKLVHPTKSNSILGESTSSKSGIGARASWMVIDEGAKIEELADIWGGLAATTPHRFVVSSADLRYGPDFYDLARAAERASWDEHATGPSYFRIPWHDHPLRNEQWLDSERARSTDPHDFAREYEINYHAGFGDWVYPYAQQMQPVPAPYSVALGQVTCALDPGIRDATALAVFQDDPGERRYRLIEGLVVKAPSAEYLAPILVGMPPAWAGWETGDYDGAAMEVAALFRAFREAGVRVRFVGDPYGDNAGGAGNESFYLALFRAANALLDDLEWDKEAYRVVVHTKYDEGARYHPKRKELTTQLLPLLDVHDSPRCRYILAALQDYRYKPLDEGRTAIAEPNKPMHGWSSHPSTAVEYFAVHAMLSTDYGRTAPRTEKVAAGKDQNFRPLNRIPLSKYKRRRVA